MNITVTGNITVSATLENSGQIGLTVGQYTYGGNQWQYGYSSADYASDQVYGSLSPDTFYGIKITSLSAGLIVDPNGSAYYYVNLPDNDTSLVMWLQSQVGKTITVNLE